MSRLSSELYNQCRNTLLKCSELDNNTALQAVFVTTELQPFQSGLPEATSKHERVAQCLNFLLSKSLSNGRPVLLIFLAVLRDRYLEGDAVRDELEALSLEVQKELEAQSSQLEPAESEYLDRLMNDSDKYAFAHYILEKAKTALLPPFGTKCTAIINKLQSILATGRTNALNESEAFILLVAACLPNLLRLYGEVFEKLISVEDVRQLAEKLNQDVLTPAGIGIALNEIASEVRTGANARRIFDPEDTNYSPSQIRNERVDLRLIGALLHLANRLNLDEFIDPQPPAFIDQLTQAERFQWWRQAYIRSVSIEGQRLQLHIRLPKGYKDEYQSFLIVPLYEELRSLIETYDPILFQVGINLNLPRPEVVGEEGILAIPDDEWQRLKQEILTEQARRSKDRLQQDVVHAQRLSELLVKSEVSLAEQMIAEERHFEGAEAFARAAALLGRTRQAYQAKNYAMQAAEHYLKAGDQLAAAQQYLQAAEVWLSYRTAPELATRQLEQAEKIASEINEPALRICVLQKQAWLAFATLRDQDAQRFWEQIKELIPQVADKEQKVELWRTSALQQATLAMVWEEWDTAREILEATLAACPETVPDVRIDLLQGLLLINIERGDWETADQIYQEAQKLLDINMDSRRSGLLAMHYAASLARRGALQEAYDTYSSAIQQLDGQADAYTLALAYQNMQHMLLRNGATFFSGFDQHEARRVDLFHTTQIEDRGYAHEVKASSELNVGNHRGAIQHIRLALAYYWRDGDWAGIEHCYQQLAMLHAAIGKPVEALLAAIRASTLKGIERYAEPLRDTSNEEQLTHIIGTLIETRPAACEQQVTAKALAVLADVVPPALLSQTLDHLLMLLQGPEQNDRHVSVRRNSAEALRKLVDQFNFEQTSRVIQVVLDQFQRERHWTITEDLLKLLEEFFVQKYPQVDQSLYAPVAEVLLNFSQSEHLRELANRVTVHLARSAPSEVRTSIVTRLREKLDHLDNLIHLAFLKEPISEEQLNGAMEQILRSINPQPVSVGQGTVVTFGGVSARAINQFNEVLPSSLYNRVIDGLLEAIINENNSPSTRVSAIWALSDLPVEVLIDRADEVAEYLAWGAEGTLPRSSLINWELESQTDPFSMIRMNTGNVAQVRLSSLRAIGRLYTHLNTESQEKVSAQLITASRDPEPIVRQGVAMALSAIEGSMIQQQRLLLALVVLMHDSAPKTCSWACVASGHLITCGLAESFAEDFIEQLITLAETSAIVEVRAGATVGLRMIAISGQLDEAMKQRVLGILAKLTNDVSFRVRRKAVVSFGLKNKVDKDS